MTNLLLFDVDGTIADAGQCIENNMVEILISLQKMGHEIGIVGGGKLDKVLYQMSNKVFFSHYFTECGCVYNKNIDKNNKDLNLQEVYKKNIREHKLYEKINILLKKDFLKICDCVVLGCTHFNIIKTLISNELKKKYNYNGVILDSNEILLKYFKKIAF